MALNERHVLILIEEGVDDREFLYPFYRVQEEGIKPVLIGTGKGTYKTKMGMELRENMSPEEYIKGNPELEGLVGLILPGGKAPERLRVNEKVKELVKKILEKNLPVAAICHGPQILISVNALRGKKATSYHTIADDLVNAGAEYVDEPVVEDGNLVTSRGPADIPFWMKRFIEKVRSSVEGS